MKLFSVAEAKSNFEELIDSTNETQERIVITKGGEPTAVILGIHDFEGLESLIEIYSDPELSASILDAIAYNKARPEKVLTGEEMRRILDQRWAREDSNR